MTMLVTHKRTKPTGQSSSIYFLGVLSRLKKRRVHELNLTCSEQSIVAIGEFGLDYDRVQFCPVEVQKKCFEKQFELCAVKPQLPLFLHLRGAACDDFVEIIKVRSILNFRRRLSSFLFLETSPPIPRWSRAQFRRTTGSASASVGFEFGNWHQWLQPQDTTEP
jgi:hypothetical protein